MANKSMDKNPFCGFFTNSTHMIMVHLHFFSVLSYFFFFRIVVPSIWWNRMDMFIRKPRTNCGMKKISSSTNICFSNVFMRSTRSPNRETEKERKIYYHYISLFIASIYYLSFLLLSLFDGNSVEKKKEEQEIETQTVRAECCVHVILLWYKLSASICVLSESELHTHSHISC